MTASPETDGAADVVVSAGAAAVVVVGTAAGADGAPAGADGVVSADGDVGAGLDEAAAGAAPVGVDAGALEAGAGDVAAGADGVSVEVVVETGASAAGVGAGVAAVGPGAAGLVVAGLVEGAVCPGAADAELEEPVTTGVDRAVVPDAEPVVTLGDTAPALPLAETPVDAGAVEAPSPPPPQAARIKERTRVEEVRVIIERLLLTGSIRIQASGCIVSESNNLSSDFFAQMCLEQLDILPSLRAGDAYGAQARH